MATVYQAGRGRETLQNQLAYPAFNGLPPIVNLWHTSHCPFRYEYAKNPVCKAANDARGTPKNVEKKVFSMRNFHFAGRSTVHAQNAMVATSHPAAALVAVDVMRAGGTAADAAVAAAGLLAVIEPQSTGIGGDCFALIQPKGEGKIVAYNGSGRAPAAATVEWYLERKINSVPLTSAHAVSIPGAIDAWDTILRDHGKLGFDTLFQPAIKAAEEGYIVAPRIAFDWKNGFDKLKKGTNTERYLLPHGKPAVAGDVIHQPELGKTLRAIAKNGRDAFYTGAIAEDMVETLRGIGGLHTLEDFARHTTETTSPIGTIYKGHDVWQCPPNGPG